MLTKERIKALSERKGVKSIAVWNFLESLGGDDWSAALQNLENDARAYGWSAATVRAIRTGIHEHFATDELLSRGFDSGNYCAAYETTDYGRGVQMRCWGKSVEYLQAFTLGFFSSYSRREIPADSVDDYDAALASPAGRRCVALGFVDGETAEETGVQEA